MNCPGCGAEFEPRDSRGQTYCSLSCAGRAGGSRHRERRGGSARYLYQVGPDGRLALEHRLILEMKLGRSLGADEVAHHIDGDKKNNDPANLAVMTRSEHQRMHMLAVWRERKGPS